MYADAAQILTGERRTIIAVEAIGQPVGQDRILKHMLDEARVLEPSKAISTDHARMIIDDRK